jgi:hypothetical protein
MKHTARRVSMLRGGPLAALISTLATFSGSALAQGTPPPQAEPTAPAPGTPEVTTTPPPTAAAPTDATTTPPAGPPATETQPQLNAQAAADAQAAVPPPPVNPERPLENEPTPVKGKWNPVMYGFVEFDAIDDSTQSLNDAAGNSVLQREGTYGGDHRRMTFGVRNSRLGFKLAAPEYAGIKATGILEMDFLGNQPPTATEAAFFNNPTFRIRHFALKLENPFVDVLIGQYWQLFGWQSSFHPNTVEIQGLPGQVYSRAAQIRLSHAFKTDPVNVEVAIAAARPPGRDSETPDGQAGLKFVLNEWKGLHTAGSTGTAVDGLAIGVSGVLRNLATPDFVAGSTNKETVTGKGISIDALIPVIPATMDDRANALTLTGSFVSGSGISDLYTGLTGGVAFPSLPNPTGATPAPAYTATLDPGIATFDADGKLQAVNWQSYMVGIQYYLPPSGKLWISANYSHIKSNNVAELTSDANKGKVYEKAHWYDVNLFWDALPSTRFGLEYARFNQTFLAGKDAHNDRFQLSAFYLF